MKGIEWLTDTSQAAPRYLVGDTVEVLRASRLPQVEEVIGAGVVRKVTNQYPNEHPNELYWIEGFEAAKSARQLRLILRGK